METRELGISGSERIFAGSRLRVGTLDALLSAGANAMVFTNSTSLATSLLGVGASVAGSTLASMHAVAAGTDVGLLTRLGRGRSCREQ
jgi:hypothetical protein